MIICIVCKTNRNTKSRKCRGIDHFRRSTGEPTQNWEAKGVEEEVEKGMGRMYKIS